MLTVLIIVVVGVTCAGIGFFAGVRTTARNADRLLAVMSDAQIVQTARKAHLRRELLGSAGEKPPSLPPRTEE